MSTSDEIKQLGVNSVIYTSAIAHPAIREADKEILYHYMNAAYQYGMSRMGDELQNIVFEHGQLDWFGEVNKALNSHGKQD